MCSPHLHRHPILRSHLDSYTNTTYSHTSPSQSVVFLVGDFLRSHSKFMQKGLRFLRPTITVMLFSLYASYTVFWSHAKNKQTKDSVLEQYPVSRILEVKVTLNVTQSTAQEQEERTRRRAAGKTLGKPSSSDITVSLFRRSRRYGVGVDQWIPVDFFSPRQRNASFANDPLSLIGPTLAFLPLLFDGCFLIGIDTVLRLRDPLPVAGLQSVTSTSPLFYSSK